MCDFFRVLIVDDEQLIRELLKKTVDWQRCGFSVVGEAADGVEGLAAMRQYRPDLAVVDINMPHMNGCRLCEKIKEEYPACRMVVLSGFNEFEYVRNALKVGARDYLLKPIVPADFEKLLCRMRDEIAEEREKSSQDVLHDRFYQVSRLNFFMKLVSQPLNEGDRAEMRYFGVDLSDRVTPAVLKLHVPAELEHDSKARAAWEYGVYNIASEMLDGAFSCYAFPMHGTVGILLDGGDAETRQAFVKRLMEISHTVAYYFEYPLTVLIGPQTETLAQLPDCYCKALEQPQAYHTGGTETVDDGHVIPLTPFYSKLTDIKTYLLGGAGEQALQTLNALLDGMAEVFLCKADVLRICEELLLTLNECLLQFDMELWQEDETVKALTDLPDFAALRQSVETLVRESLRQIEGGKRTKTTVVVKTAIGEIGARFGDPMLCLDEISERCEVHPVYLCKVFKRHTGYSVMEYLAKTRMEAAYERLLHGGESVQEVALSVGYNDVYYFSKCFKKRYGITPSAMRGKERK